MLRKLGLREGAQYNYFRKQEYVEAQKSVQEFIKRHYVRHPSTRRLHYMLKELGYIEYDNEVCAIKMCRYKDCRIGLEIHDVSGEEPLYQDNIRVNTVPVGIEIRTAFPLRAR